MGSDEISLRQLISAVSDELIASRAERLAHNRPPLFEVKELSIEASFVVTSTDSGGGGFDLKIVKANAKTDYKQETVHKIVLKLAAFQGESGAALPELGDELPVRPRSSE